MPIKLDYATHRSDLDAEGPPFRMLNGEFVIRSPMSIPPLCVVCGKKKPSQLGGRQTFLAGDKKISYYLCRKHYLLHKVWRLVLLSIVVLFIPFLWIVLGYEREMRIAVGFDAAAVLIMVYAGLPVFFLLPTIKVTGQQLENGWVHLHFRSSRAMQAFAAYIKERM